MLEARITDKEGRDVDIIGADTAVYCKEDFRILAAQGCLRCTDCDAEVTHVKGTAEDEKILGDTVSRVPHFRSRDIKDHAPECLNRDDPRDAKKVLAFKDALETGLPILINVNFDMGFSGLRNRFNTLVDNGDSGLWNIGAWKKKIGKKDKFHTVRARDITDVLHYLEIAKEVKGQDGLKQLWFNNHKAVQSCMRTVIGDNPRQIERLMNDLIKRAVDSKKSQTQRLIDTPRLFLFRATNRQIDIASTDRVSKLYGQKASVQTPVPHDVKLGLSLKNGLSNQAVLDDGRDVWVFAAPFLARTRALELDAQARGYANKNKGKPAFLFLDVGRRGQFVALDAGRKEPRHKQPEYKPPRQLALELSGTSSPT